MPTKGKKGRPKVARHDNLGRMGKKLVRTVALLLVSCLLADPLAEPAFSNTLAPLWQMGTVDARRMLVTQSALVGPFIPDTYDGFKRVSFVPGSSPWRRWWIEETTRLGLPTSLPALKAQIRRSYKGMAKDVRVAAQKAVRGLAQPGPFKAPRHIRLNAWVANFHPRVATQALKNYTQHLNELSIFGAGAHINGRMAPEKDFIASALRAAKQVEPRPRVLLTVANISPQQAHNRMLLERWLGTPERRRRHVYELVKLAESVDGLDVDYENLSPRDVARYPAFISILGRELHARGKYLTVTVEHQLFAGGKMDWKTVTASVDRVRVMAYQYHYERTRPGPVSPPDAVVKLARRALAVIPIEKLEIALPLYGFDWTREGGRLVPTMEQYKKLARQANAWEFRDSRTQSGRIDYFVSQGTGKQKRLIRHEVWFEDPASVAYKIARLQQLGVVHIGLWQMGVGDISELFKLAKFSRS